MTRFNIKDYCLSVMYEVDVTSGQIKHVPWKEGFDALSMSDGYGSWVSVELGFKKSKLFVALFTDGKTLFLKYGDLFIDCLAGEVRAFRELWLPGVKRFTVRVDGETRVASKYWWIDRTTWPDDGDIRSHVARITENKTNMIFTVLLRTGAKRGANVGNVEVAEDLRRRAELMAQSWNGDRH